MGHKRTTVIALGALLSLAGCAATAYQLARSQVAGTRCQALGDLDQRVPQLLAANNSERVEPV